MKNTSQTTIQLLKMLIVFILLTAVFYYGMIWMDQHQQNVHRYEEPGAGAAEVSAITTGGEGQYMFWHVQHDYARLIEFLRDGE
ncbi:DUF4227 family protein [Sporolactobacillus kofuensis]|uniref:DUF4227 family protein n=1 Tax=Sporolactobacillus kofuensis TaxID=269672 RepID=A0ABW1WF16_9BACL|nr:DUF4227 family protein [Sporolactobacillus kofuensis]MCO7176647.1 YqzK family protein [Sporolactobacillus kofuensis]